MWAITSSDALAHFQGAGSFVSIFLTDRYDTEVVRNLAESFDAYNKQLGQRWHLMLPYRGGSYELNEALEQVAVYPENFDEDLAKEIAVFFKIKPAEFPCIVFVFEEEFLTVSIPMLGKDLRLFFTHLSQGIDEFWFENNRDSDARKQYMIDVIRNLKLKGIYVNAIDAAQKPKTYLKLIPSLIKIVNGLKP